MLVRVKVERVTLDTATSRFVVILKDENQNRWLPIVVGSTEAQAIALQLEKISPPRPLTHDLIKNLLESLNVFVSRIVVNDLRENTYYALIGLQNDNEFQDIDARPSDAIALALRMNAPIFVEDGVMQRAGISERVEEMESAGGDEELSPGDQLEQLNLDLRKAIQDERYEEAAQIRDEIKRIKQSLRENLE
ncbi:bifunctional nuclease family protein [candidate division KSB1 bacterium]|nr:bifunctional nuclease family protein [candidate division KSB1 bacterium]